MLNTHNGNFNFLTSLVSNLECDIVFKISNKQFAILVLENIHVIVHSINFDVSSVILNLIFALSLFKDNIVKKSLNI